MLTTTSRRERSIVVLQQHEHHMHGQIPTATQRLHELSRHSAAAISSTASRSVDDPTATAAANVRVQRRRIRISDAIYEHDSDVAGIELALPHGGNALAVQLLLHGDYSLAGV